MAVCFFMCYHADFVWSVHRKCLQIMDSDSQQILKNNNTCSMFIQNRFFKWNASLIFKLFHISLYVLLMADSIVCVCVSVYVHTQFYYFLSFPFLQIAYFMLYLVLHYFEIATYLISFASYVSILHKF